jgi:hypothetical protein
VSTGLAGRDDFKNFSFGISRISEHLRTPFSLTPCFHAVPANDQTLGTSLAAPDPSGKTAQWVLRFFEIPATSGWGSVLMNGVPMFLWKTCDRSKTTEQPKG